MDFVTEAMTAWNRILLSGQLERPVVLYGMGNGADKIVDFCKQNNVEIGGIFASDDFVRGQSFHGIKVERFEDLRKRLRDDFLLILAFASEQPELLEKFKALSKRYSTVAPHLGLFDDNVVSEDWLEQHDKELNEAYKILADSTSRLVFTDMLNYKYSGNIDHLYRHTTQRAEDMKLLELGNEEVYYDLGAFWGDTVNEFLQTTGNSYRAVVAVEPDNKSFAKLTGNFSSLRDFYPIDKAMWSEIRSLPFNYTGGRQASVYGAKNKMVQTTTLDTIVNDTNLPPTFIKMDVEGTEMQTIMGGEKTISKYKPKMLIAGYHFDADLYRIPLKLHELNPEYKIYLRKHPYVPDWEINFFVK